MESSIQERIKNYLKELEISRGIKILLACETGSRAWGFPSPDSDYDVRIIYQHDSNWYLKLFPGKDSIELFLESNEVDISGWDLRKSLLLLHKSNPPLLERLQSPILYYENPEFRKDIWQEAQLAYSPIASIHHYLGLAKKSFADVKGCEKYKLKKLFYALRAALTCTWICQESQIPPIVFSKVLDRIDLSNSQKNRIQELIDLKSTKSESYLHHGEVELIELIESSISMAESKAKLLGSGNRNIDNLDALFIRTLKR